LQNRDIKRGIILCVEKERCGERKREREREREERISCRCNDEEIVVTCGSSQEITAAADFILF
jgi:hypothetical protein